MADPVMYITGQVVGGEELNVALYPTDGWGAENLRRGLDHAIIGDVSVSER